MLQLLETLGLKALEIPTDPRTGLSIEALDLATRDGQVTACLLVPNASNPLGSMMPDEHKRRLAKLTAERGVAVIEDDIYGDLHFGSKPPRPIKAFDKAGNVLLCSSFSKCLSPALRSVSSPPAATGAGCAAQDGDQRRHQSGHPARPRRIPRIRRLRSSPARPAAHLRAPGRTPCAPR
jgi:hypothetical protein